MSEPMPGRPLTAEEAAEVMANTEAAIKDGGLWLMNCARCGTNIGGCLAAYGKPTHDGPMGTKYCACPECPAVGEVVLEYVPPEMGGIN